MAAAAMFPRDEHGTVGIREGSDEHGTVGIREGSKGGQSPPLANDLACKV